MEKITFKNVYVDQELQKTVLIVEFKSTDGAGNPVEREFDFFKDGNEVSVICPESIDSFSEYFLQKYVAAKITEEYKTGKQMVIFDMLEG